MQTKLKTNTQVLCFDLFCHGLCALTVVTADRNNSHTAFFKLWYQALEFDQVLGADGTMQASVKHKQVKRRCG